MVWRLGDTHYATRFGQELSKKHLKLWRRWINGLEVSKYGDCATKEIVLKQRDIIERKVWGNLGDTPGY